MPNLHFFGANKVQILKGKDNMYKISNFRGNKYGSVSGYTYYMSAVGCSGIVGYSSTDRPSFWIYLLYECSQLLRYSRIQ